MSYSIRRLTGDDVEAYRTLRLEALTNHPTAFFSSADDFMLRSSAELVEVLERLMFLGAVTPAGQLVGMMAFEPGQKRQSHRGWIFQVYVQPSMRGTGCAKALPEAVIEHAKTEVHQLHLSVESQNKPAIRLYQSAGFTIYGTDPRYMSVNGRYIDEHLMVRFLDRDAAQQQGTMESDKSE